MNILDIYGFENQEQKLALYHLLEESGVDNPAARFMLIDKSNDRIFEKILDFVALTQQKFTLRTGVQERWEIAPANWMRDPSKQEKIFAALKTLNLLDSIEPSFSERDVVCVLGTVKDDINLRLSFSAEVLPAHNLVLLSGERKVIFDYDGKSIDGSKEELELIAKKINKNLDDLNEMDLMRNSYGEHEFIGADNVYFIDSSKGNLPRATTEIAIMEFCKWLKEHQEIKKITFISNQPFVEYQKCIIEAVFKQQNLDLKFEVIGPKLDCSVNHDEKIKEAVEALGSRIYAATPKIVADLNLKIKSQELEKEFANIYKKQPLTYSNIQHNFIINS